MSAADTTVRPQGETEVVVSRRFEAPAPAVFAAWTDPALLRRWLGRADWVMVECVSDLRTGGRRRMVWWRPTDAARMGVDGAYTAVHAPDGYACTATFDGSPDHTVETTRFREHDGRTLVVLTIDYESAAARARALATPMADGLDEGFRRLDDFLSSIQSAPSTPTDLQESRWT